MRGGEEFAGALGGARVGKFLGLGSRVVCGEDKGAAVADATAVDMVLPTSEKESGLAVVLAVVPWRFPELSRLTSKDYVVTARYFRCINSTARDQRPKIPRRRGGASMEAEDRKPT
jgi:hypothetical protein